MSRSIRLFMFAAPSRFYWLTGKLLPWLWATAALFAIAGLYMGFFVAPTDATQGSARTGTSHRGCHPTWR